MSEIQKKIGKNRQRMNLFRKKLIKIVQNRFRGVPTEKKFSRAYKFSMISASCQETGETRFPSRTDLLARFSNRWSHALDLRVGYRAKCARARTSGLVDPCLKRHPLQSSGDPRDISNRDILIKILWEGSELWVIRCLSCIRVAEISRVTSRRNEKRRDKWSIARDEFRQREREVSSRASADPPLSHRVTTGSVRKKTLWIFPESLSWCKDETNAFWDFFPYEYH